MPAGRRTAEERSDGGVPLALRGACLGVRLDAAVNAPFALVDEVHLYTRARAHSREGGGLAAYRDRLRTAGGAARERCRGTARTCSTAPPSDHMTVLAGCSWRLSS